jgi:hypothetical protein
VLGFSCMRTKANGTKGGDFVAIGESAIVIHGLANGRSEGRIRQCCCHMSSPLPVNTLVPPAEKCNLRFSP